MRKQYTAPSLKAYKVNSTAILNTGSEIPVSKGSGGPSKAKSDFDTDWD